jgi:nicotinamidase-related amidase
MTHNCVDATIKHALGGGYQVEFLRDASGSVSYANDAGGKSAQEIHDAYAVVLQSRFAAVATTSRWIQALGRGEVLARQTIDESHRNARKEAQRP